MSVYSVAEGLCVPSPCRSLIHLNLSKAQGPPEQEICEAGVRLLGKIFIFTP